MSRNVKSPITSQLAEQIADSLRQRIGSGEFLCGSRLSAMRTLAKEYEASKTTVALAVSRLVNDGLLSARHGQGTTVISTDVPERERQVRAMTLGLVCRPSGGDLFASPYYAQLYESVCLAATQQKYSVMLLPLLGDNLEGMQHLTELAQAKRLDGFLYLVSSTVESAVCQLCTRFNLPMLTIDCFEDSGRWDSVVIDNRMGMNLLVRNLIDIGHRRIAYINISANNINSRERFEAYQAALSHANLAFDKALVRQADPWPEMSKKAMRELLAYQPTAVVCFNSDQALGAAWAITEAGLSVHQDICVTGFGEVAPTYGAAASTFPTAVFEPQDMGDAAVQRILQRISTPAQSPQKILVPTRMLRAEMMAPPPTVTTTGEVLK